MTKRVSKSQTRVYPVHAGAAGGRVHKRCRSACERRTKGLRYAFSVAETGFDPAQVQDFYSSKIMGNIFDAPLAYDFIARPAKIVTNTAESLPEVSSDFTTITVRIRPGIYFQDHPAFKGQSASSSHRTTSTRSSASTTRSSRVQRIVCSKTRKLLGMNRSFARQR